MLYNRLKSSTNVYGIIDIARNIQIRLSTKMQFLQLHVFAFPRQISTVSLVQYNAYDSVLIYLVSSDIYKIPLLPPGNQ